jgi:dihydroorotate dehydrogenase
MMYKLIIKPFLFLFAPEKAHHLALRLFRITLAIPFVNTFLKQSLKTRTASTNVMGLTFPNKVGLAAGFDKDGKYLDLMSNMGFGFLEIGTVTPKGQAGNPKPRLFRLPKDEALINRMGFNNEGLDAFEKRLRKGKPENVIIGANIGKNKVTPNAEAVEDYKICFDRLHPYADYFVVNVSSPNTPGLRELQDKGPLLEILSSLQKINKEKGEIKPILLKIAPDLNDAQLEDIAEIVKESNIEGIVATNTTIDRGGLSTSRSDVDAIGNGGLSGAPLKTRSTEVIRKMRDLLGPEPVIIGVGGISSAEDAREKIAAGANLVQVYSGLIYEGPWMVKKMVKAL